METFSVISPAGLEAVKAARPAPRLSDLNGKTVAEVWNGVFKGDVAFPLVHKLLKQRYPSINIIPYTEFYHLPGSDVPAHQRTLTQEIVEQAHAKGADAVITGMGA